MFNTTPQYAIPDHLNMNNLGSKRSSSFTVIQAESFSWKLPIPVNLNYDSDYKWSAEELHHIANSVIQNTLGESSNVNMNFDKGLHDVTAKISQAGAAISGWSDAQFKNGIIDGLNNTDLARAGKQAALKAASRMIGGNDAVVKEFYKRHGNVAYNANEQLYFDGVGLRDFNINFSLAPTSQAEANEIRSSFKSLAQKAAPGFTGGDFYFTYPSYFSIAVIVNGVKLLERSNLAITALNCDLSSEGQLSWHDDGFPTALMLNIGFKESVIPTKENLQNITFLGTKLS